MTPRACAGLLAMMFAGASAHAQSRDAYTASIRAIARRQAADDSIADPGARSILLTSGAPAHRAVLLLHGLTDSPRQFETLAYLLRAEGANVYVPRLPRHGLRGGDVRRLSALTAEAMHDAADSMASEARGLGDSLIVVGLSLGGVMAAWIAQEQSITRAVLIAPAIEPSRIPSVLDRPIIGLADRLPDFSRRSAPDSGRSDREPGFSLHATAEMFQLGSAVTGAAEHRPSHTRDIVILVNASDRTVSTSAAERLGAAWAEHGARVAVFELPDSLRLPHNILDPLRGSGGGAAVLELIRELAYGETPLSLVRRLR